MVRQVGELNFSRLITSKAALNLKIGDTVFGRILGILENGKVVGVFNGTPLFAQTNLKLKVGQKILARVIEIKNGKYILKMMDEASLSSPKSETEKLGILFKRLGLQADEKSQTILKKMLAFKVPLSRDIFWAGVDLSHISEKHLSFFCI
jgi:hypothetical protein